MLFISQYDASQDSHISHEVRILGALNELCFQEFKIRSNVPVLNWFGGIAESRNCMLSVVNIVAKWVLKLFVGIKFKTGKFEIEITVYFRGNSKVCVIR